ncbi:MAG: penicillin-binding protein 2 [Spirochaetales bacterium]|nr:penicillin-binding protein 2 [Spirochaetales bacterium]
MSSAPDPSKGSLKGRLLVLGIASLLVFAVYAGHLFNLQIVENLIWEGKARDVARRSEVLPAQRGLIWDRNGDKPLALNIDSFAIQIIPAEISPSNPQELAEKLAPVLKMKSQSILDALPTNWRNSWNPVEIKNGVDYGTVVALAEASEDYPGLVWSSKPYRWYNSIGSISHLLGYVGNITAEELQLLYNEGYENTASLGKSGVERAYDGILRGTDGQSYRTVDVKGKELSDGGVIPPKNGLDIVLTIDRRIQTLAEKALGPRKGAMVVLKPATGEILAMVSYPSYDPNRFAEPGPGNFGALSLNTDFPFLNRAIQSGYAPASTFKLIMTAAILGENAIDPDIEVNCTGSMTLGNREFKCWKRSGHGLVDLEEALENSCNIYFGTVGVEELGIDVIAKYARAFGLGSPTGVALEGEVGGIVPGKTWKEEVYHSPWTGGDTLNASVGQGFLTVTPLQMANVLAGIANNGKIYRPRILKEVRDSVSGDLVERTEPELLRSIEYLEEEDYDYLQNAMRGVITEGTGEYVIYTDSVEIAGKTGTGEVGSEDRWHDWFVAYGPWKAENPEDQVVVVSIAEASENYDYWSPKATDLVFEGIFGGKTYEEVVAEWRSRRVWWSWDTIDLPYPGHPFQRPAPENEDEEE